MVYVTFVECQINSYVIYNAQETITLGPYSLSAATKRYYWRLAPVGPNKMHSGCVDTNMIPKGNLKSLCKGSHNSLIETNV